jgi:hypothetical protein
MIGEDFGPVRVLATESVGRIACDARVLRLREHVRAQGQKTAEGAVSAACKTRPVRESRKTMFLH